MRHPLLARSQLPIVQEDCLEIRIDQRVIDYQDDLAVDFVADNLAAHAMQDEFDMYAASGAAYRALQV